jgi:hypothetical protein
MITGECVGRLHIRAHCEDVIGGHGSGAEGRREGGRIGTWGRARDRGRERASSTGGRRRGSCRPGRPGRTPAGGGTSGRTDEDEVTETVTENTTLELPSANQVARFREDLGAPGRYPSGCDSTRRGYRGRALALVRAGWTGPPAGSGFTTRRSRRWSATTSARVRAFDALLDRVLRPAALRSLAALWPGGGVPASRDRGLLILEPDAASRTRELVARDAPRGRG